MPLYAGWSSASPASTGAGVWPLYAKVQACVILEDRVWKAIGEGKSVVGTSLMERAFGKNGPLRLSDENQEQIGASYVWYCMLSHNCTTKFRCGVSTVREAHERYGTHESKRHRKTTGGLTRAVGKVPSSLEDRITQ